MYKERLEMVRRMPTGRRVWDVPFFLVPLNGLVLLCLKSALSASRITAGMER